MCLYPKLIKNPKYKPNKKNGGRPPFCHDIRIMYVPIGCGQCMECMKKKAREWQIRLQEEIRHNKNGKFITLTFSNEELEKLRENENETENDIATKAIRRFLERWRKKFKKSVKHWFCTELGHNGTERIHLHGILWTDENHITIQQIWKYGMIWQGKFVNEKTINYIVKYIHKMDTDHLGYKPKVLTSAGIGKGYIERPDSKLNKYNKNTDESYKFRNGQKSSLPIYYRNKIYTEEERQNLWIEKIDKQERWVCGERIDISKGYKEYWETLKWYQRKNIRLGYGEREKWNKETYKKELKYEKEKCVKIAPEPHEEQDRGRASLMLGNANAWFNS